jgi:hypothetical protein
MPEGGGGGGGTILRIALEFLKRVRERQARESAGQSPGNSATSGNLWQPKPPPVFPTLRTFTDYLFKPGATHGKDNIFRSLGFGPEDRTLADDFIRQATQRYSARDFVSGLADQYGQRLTIPIDLNGPSGQYARILSAWMLRPDGQLSLCSPYTGHAR